MTKDYGTVLTNKRATKVVAAALAAAMLSAAAHSAPQRLPLKISSAALAVEIAAATPVAIVDAFHAALARGDTRAALDFLAENVVIFESGGVERSRAEYANHHLGADAAFSAAVRRTRVSRSHGEAGDAAWVLSVEAVLGAYRGRAINSRSVETMLLRRFDSQWRISHIHWSSKDIVPKK